MAKWSERPLFRNYADLARIIAGAEDAGTEASGDLEQNGIEQPPGKRQVKPETAAFRASFTQAAAAHAIAELVRLGVLCSFFSCLSALHVDFCVRYVDLTMSSVLNSTFGISHVWGVHPSMCSGFTTSNALDAVVGFSHMHSVSSSICAVTGICTAD